MRLSNAALHAVGSGIAVPAYDRGQVTPGLVHLGIGAFHRAHQAVYVDDCLAAGEKGWGIVAASLRSPDTRDALAPQDGLYTLALRDTGRERLRVLGSVTDVLAAPEAPGRLLDTLVDPRIRIVTLTITEKGYAVDLGTGALRTDHPDVVHDLGHPAQPRSALGFLAEALARRRQAGLAPFTLLSCDNLPCNGQTLRRVLVEFAAARGDDLAAYIENEVDCPSSMVDRIVPATTEADRSAVSARLGVTDAWPVVAEPFSQWVVEDRFRGGRPHLEACGVEFVADVQPFEHMKLRLLNGAHSALAAIGRLAGCDTIADAMARPVIRRFLGAYWAEVMPTLQIDAAAAGDYTRRLVARFDNRDLHHRTAQIASDASQKLPQRILAPLRERLAAGAPREALVFAVAAWIRSCGGWSDAGAALPLNDPPFEAWSGRPDQRTTAPAAVARAFLGLSAVFGADLPANEAFAGALGGALDDIARHGVIGALRQRFVTDGPTG